MKLSCPLVHPGICVTDDAEIYASLEDISIGIEHEIKKSMNTDMAEIMVIAARAKTMQSLDKKD